MIKGEVCLLLFSEQSEGSRSGGYHAIGNMPAHAFSSICEPIINAG